MENGWDGAVDFDIKSFYSDENVDLEVAHFLSKVSTSFSGRSSIEVLPEPFSNDGLFVRATQIISKTKRSIEDEELANLA
jgi:hypothetical protein